MDAPAFAADSMARAVSSRFAARSPNAGATWQQATTVMLTTQY
jgi:hypothetical protein